MRKLQYVPICTVPTAIRYRVYNGSSLVLETTNKWLADIELAMAYDDSFTVKTDRIDKRLIKQ
jgi:hypothetical protein